jgi:hypothetical protein
LPNEWIDLIVIRTQHLIDYALDKAAQRLQRQEPELGVKVRVYFEPPMLLSRSHHFYTVTLARGFFENACPLSVT